MFSKIQKQAFLTALNSCNDLKGEIIEIFYISQTSDSYIIICKYLVNEEFCFFNLNVQFDDQNGCDLSNLRSITEDEYCAFDRSKNNLIFHKYENKFEIFIRLFLERDLGIEKLFFLRMFEDYFVFLYKTKNQNNLVLCIEQLVVKEDSSGDFSEKNTIDQSIFDIISKQALCIFDLNQQAEHAKSLQKTGKQSADAIMKNFRNKN